MFPKTKFSMLTNEVQEVLATLGREIETVILCGIEVNRKQMSVLHIHTFL